MKFYLGTHETSWLGKLDVPLFVSHRRLAKRRTFPVARAPWALDSGGFTELSLFGRWETTARDYVSAVRVYAEEIGNLEWASPQDWMCEPWIIAKTGLTVKEHQLRTIDNLIQLRHMAPDLRFIPVLQGWELDDYHAHADMYGTAGVDLTGTVGIGSVCRRQSEGQIAVIVQSLAQRGLKLHGFGMKHGGLQVAADWLTSADSMAWSYRARRASTDGHGGFPGCTHGTCSSCPKFALRWRDRVLTTIANQQLTLDLGGAA